METMTICPHCLFPFVKICSQWSHRLEKRQFPLSNPGLSSEAADKPCTAPLTVSHHLKSNGSGIRVLQKACKFTIHSETHKCLSNMNIHNIHVKYITSLLWAKVAYSHNIDPVLGRLWSLCFIQASASTLKSHFISHSHVLKVKALQWTF